VTIGAVYLESDARIILRAISLRFNEKFRKHLRSQEAFMKGFPWYFLPSNCYGNVRPE